MPNATVVSLPLNAPLHMLTATTKCRRPRSVRSSGRPVPAQALKMSHERQPDASCERSRGGLCGQAR